jgi:hypothetical protein
MNINRDKLEKTRKMGKEALLWSEVAVGMHDLAILAYKNNKGPAWNNIIVSLARKSVLNFVRAVRAAYGKLTISFSDQPRIILSNLGDIGLITDRKAEFDYLFENADLPFGDEKTFTQQQVDTVLETEESLRIYLSGRLAKRLQENQKEALGG